MGFRAMCSIRFWKECCNGVGDVAIGRSEKGSGAGCSQGFHKGSGAGCSKGFQKGSGAVFSKGFLRGVPEQGVAEGVKKRFRSRV